MKSVSLGERLGRECAPGHCLHGIHARLVAYRVDRDEFLFELSGEGAPGAFAVVKLPFGSTPEDDPAFPETKVYASFAEWVTECMNPAADAWAAKAGSKPVS